MSLFLISTFGPQPSLVPRCTLLTMNINSVFCSFLFLWYILTNHNYKHKKVSLANTPHTWSYKLQRWMFHGRVWNNVLPRCIAIRAAVFSAFDTWALSNSPRGAKIFAHRATEPQSHALNPDPPSRLHAHCAGALNSKVRKKPWNWWMYISLFLSPQFLCNLKWNLFPT